MVFMAANGYCMATRIYTAKTTHLVGRRHSDAVLGKTVMGKCLSALVVAAFLAPTIVLLLESPASAISADLAKKCREMAIKAHPPPLTPGGKPYAQAEREFYAECIAKKGQMNNTGTQDAGAPKNPAEQK